MPMDVEDIQIWVSGGSFAAPYYRFFSDEAGSQELKNLSLNTDYSYTFRRLNKARSHPFYLSDSGFKKASTNAVIITGDGSPSSGITGSQAFNISFNKKSEDIRNLLYYCSAHSFMQADMHLTENEPLANNAPQGTLLITGKTESGKTLFLNHDSITDKDGINSEIGFSHSWQIYDVDTSSWLDLDTTDANDGDANLTLTTELVSRKLRGRTSYVDGAGLTESLTSDPVTIRRTLPPILPGTNSKTIYTPFENISYIPGTSVELPLLFDTRDNDPILSSFTLNVHYDSSILTPIGDGSVFQFDDVISSARAIDDTTDIDNDTATDKLIELSWNNANSSFPDTDLPVSIATVEFRTSTQQTDPLTGQSMRTRLNTTAPEAAIGGVLYDFISTSITLEATPFNLDVDGDGRTTALGDGLMVIRKLFGTAFSGDALTNRARTASATRSTTDIHDFIQIGIDTRALDVDQDGEVTALGDGLLIIRRMFGSAFAGSSLIERAINENSSFYGQNDAWQSVAANIDALIPEKAQI